MINLALGTLEPTDERGTDDLYQLQGTDPGRIDLRLTILQSFNLISLDNPSRESDIDLVIYIESPNQSTRSRANCMTKLTYRQDGFDLFLDPGNEGKVSERGHDVSRSTITPRLILRPRSR